MSDPKDLIQYLQLAGVFQIPQVEKLFPRFRNLLFIQSYQDNLESTVCSSPTEKSICEERACWECGVTQQILLIFWVCNSFRSWLQVFYPSLYLYLFPWDCISSNAKKSTFHESGPVLWIALPNGMQQKWQQCALSEPGSKKAPCFCQEKSTGLAGWVMRDTVSSAPDLRESPGDTNSKAVLVDNPRYQVNKCSILEAAYVLWWLCSAIVARDN